MLIIYSPYWDTGAVRKTGDPYIASFLFIYRCRISILSHHQTMFDKFPLFCKAGLCRLFPQKLKEARKSRVHLMYEQNLSRCGTFRFGALVSPFSTIFQNVVFFLQVGIWHFFPQKLEMLEHHVFVCCEGQCWFSNADRFHFQSWLQHFREFCKILFVFERCFCRPEFQFCALLPDILLE